jgi:hypothetical protein
MEKRKRRRGPGIMSEVLTLRMTPEEMLRFKVAALSLGRKRAAIVRERVADLIRAPTATTALAAASPAAEPPGGGSCDTVIQGETTNETVADETVASGMARP